MPEYSCPEFAASCSRWCLSEKALEKSGEEFEKYKQVQKQIEHEQSLKEIEADIKKWKS